MDKAYYMTNTGVECFPVHVLAARSEKACVYICFEVKANFVNNILYIRECGTAILPISMIQI